MSGPMGRTSRKSPRAVDRRREWRAMPRLARRRRLGLQLWERLLQCLEAAQEIEKGLGGESRVLGSDDLGRIV